ncbi:MAG: UDP-glucose/GDP-mannose dehydrogenase family protein [Chloroflexi bacterium]|nr:UDP-glucose/GDP-mannose dehydrogenase family protein [Chloroflexota bacterium]
MNISIIGAGYVGLVTGACLADKGHQVVCVEVDPDKVAKINRGIPPIHEPGLPELLAKNIKRNLRASADLFQAVRDTDVTLIAVGTPFDGAQIDLTYIKEAARQIGAALQNKNTYHLIVVKSTVVPGTTEQVVRPILEQASGKHAGIDFGLGMNPEFLTEGIAVRDFMLPDRIVLGGIDQKSLDELEQVYHPFAGVPRIRTNTQTAEMIKYVSNALLATMISFANEIGNLSAQLGAIDIVDVMRAIHINNYLSVASPDGARVVAPITSFLEAGCGFGGSCLPKDVQALIAHGHNAGAPMRLLDAVIQINQQQHRQVIGLLKKHFASLRGVQIAILGLAFKPDTDDMRESPAIPIIHALRAEGARIQAYDPIATAEARKIFGATIEYCDSLADALQNVQAVVLVTRWDEFYNVPDLLQQIHPAPVFVDGRRMLDKQKISRYEGIGLSVL